MPTVKHKEVVVINMVIFKFSMINIVMIGIVVNSHGNSQNSTANKERMDSGNRMVNGNNMTGLVSRFNMMVHSKVKLILMTGKVTHGQQK